MKIAMIGSGYVGLVSGVCFAEFGLDVVCVDTDAAKIEGLRRGEIPIYEPGLEQLLPRNVERGRLTFTTDLAGAAAVEMSLSRSCSATWCGDCAGSGARGRWIKHGYHGSRRSCGRWLRS